MTTERKQWVSWEELNYYLPGLSPIYTIDFQRIGGLVPGSIPFADASGLLDEDNANLFWDETNVRLGVGIGAPVCTGHFQAAVCGAYAGIYPDAILLIENDDHVYIQLQGATNANAGIIFADDDFNPPAGMIRYDFADDQLEITIATNQLIEISSTVFTSLVPLFAVDVAALGVPAIIRIDTNDADGYYELREDGALKWTIGYDYSDSQKFQISEGIPGTTVKFEIEPGAAGLINLYVDLALRNNQELRFYDNGNYVGFKAPALGADQIWILPVADGALGEHMVTDGAGNLSWTTGAGTGDVSAAANIADHSIVRGNGGAKGVQDSGIIIDDIDNVSGMGTLGCGNVTVTGTTPTFTINISDADNYGGVFFYEGITVKGAVQSIGSTFAVAARRNDIEIYNHLAADITFHANGVPRFYITDDWKLGTTGGGQTATQNMAGLYLNPDAVNVEMTVETSAGIEGGIFVYTAGTIYMGAWSNHPVTLRTNNIDRMVFDTSGNAGLGQATFGTNATKTLALGTGVAPTTSPADCFQMYSADIGGVAGKAGAHFRDEEGNVVSIGSGGLLSTGTARVLKRVFLNNAAFTKGNTAPTQVILGFLNGWEFDIGDDAVMTSMMPDDWDETTDITIKVCWYIDEAYAADKEIQWRVDWSALPHDFSETVDTPTHTGNISSGDINIPAVAKRMGTSTVGVIVAANLAAGDMLGFKLSRIAVTNDNPTNDPTAHHLSIEYISNKLGVPT